MILENKYWRLKMKTIVINASPRKNWNTGKIMKSAAKGAESVGAEVEYFNLYEIDFKGCMSCLACKRANKEKGICYYKDDLTPIFDKILEADTLLLGAPNYLGDVASGFRALYERLIFCVLSYDGGPSYYKGKLNIGLFYTMNAPKEYYDNFNKPTFDNYKNTFANFFNGKVIDYPVFNTLQVNDYSKFNIAMFDEENKKESREKQFPIDLEEAFKIGAELSKGE